MVSKIFNSLRVLIFKPFGFGPFIKLGNYIFGNFSGLKQNIFGKFHLLLSKYCNFFLGFRMKLSKELNLLKRNGYVTFAAERLNNKILIDELDKKISKYIPKKRKNNIYILPNDKLLNEKELISSLIEKKVSDLLEAYYGGGYKISSASFRYTFFPGYKKETEQYSDYWHFDSSPSSTLSVFVLLSNTTDKDGPMEILNFENSKKIVRMGYTSRRKKEFWNLINKNPKVEKFTGAKGSILISKVSSCLHRATFPNPGKSRKMLVISIFPVFGKSDKLSFKESWIYKLTH